MKHGNAGFWDSCRGPLCPELICVFQFHTLRDSSRSHQACTVALVVDAPSPRADHAFSGRIAKRGPRSVVDFCDASWNVASVSGGVLMFQVAASRYFLENRNAYL